MVNNLRKFPLYLAPMEDVTDPAFRLLCKRFGADRVYTEFVNCDALVRDVASTTRKLQIHDEERPVAIQIYGRDPVAMADAARLVEQAHPDYIDINFGCPVKKVAGKGAGAGLLRDVPKLLEITKAVVNAVNIPVTVKTRLGWDHDSLYSSPWGGQSNRGFIVDLAEAIQDCGATELALHGRTRSQMYSGAADWTLIGAVKNNSRMHIPIIGNGDVTTPQRAKECFDRYGVDAVMIGRATFGNPWLFEECRRYIDGFDSIKRSMAWCVEILKEHVERSIEWVGDERKGIVHSRRHFAASPVFKGLYDFKQTRIALLRADTKDEVFSIMDDIVRKWGTIRTTANLRILLATRTTKTLKLTLTVIKAFLDRNALMLSMLSGAIGYPVFRLGMPLLPPMIFLMLFFTFCKVNPLDLRLHAWHWIVLASQLSLSVGIYYALLHALPDEEGRVIAQGIMVCVIMPTATAAPIIAGKLGGSIQNLTTFTLLSNVATAIVVPAFFPIVNPESGIDFQVASWLILRKVGPLLLLPFFSAWALRAIYNRVQRNKGSDKTFILSKNWATMPFYLWTGTLVVLMADITYMVLNTPISYRIILWLCGGALATCLMQFFLGKAIGERWPASSRGVDYQDVMVNPAAAPTTPAGISRITAGQALGQKNTSLGVWMAQAYLSPLSAIGPAAYIIWQNAFNSMQLVHAAHSKSQE